LGKYILLPVNPSPQMCEIGLVRFDLSLPESQCEPFHFSSCEVAPLRCECVVVMLLIMVSLATRWIFHPVCFPVWECSHDDIAMVEHLMFNTIFPDVWIDSGGVPSTRALETLRCLAQGTMPHVWRFKLHHVLAVRLSPWEMCPKVITLRG